MTFTIYDQSCKLVMYVYDYAKVSILTMSRSIAGQRTYPSLIPFTASEFYARCRGMLADDRKKEEAKRREEMYPVLRPQRAHRKSSLSWKFIKVLKLDLYQHSSRGFIYESDRESFKRLFVSVRIINSELI